MKHALTPLALLAFAAAFAVQVRLPSPLQAHVDTLAKAQTLSGKVSVQQVAGGTEDVSFTLSRPDKWRYESDSQLVTCDGKTVTVFSKANKTYSQSPMTSASPGALTALPALLPWSTYFSQEPAKAFSAASAGAKRSLRGANVTEVTIALAGNKGSGTLYIDGATGLARGGSLKSGGKDYIVWASEIKPGAAADDSLFAFTPPPGSKKAEVAAPPSAAAPTWASVAPIFARSCMPCHGATKRSGIDLRAYESATAGRWIIPGNPRASSLLNAVKSGSMPMGRGKLPAGEIAAIEAWISGGAKR